ncbi:glycosyltransferase family 9 protein [Fusobacterium sp. HC1336]|uniref:glycosyltransferase family 9 protein n=1 Tax=Fusobacterium sp. HC1336 TaxID=3171169 RepID=UPI003F1F52F7
MKLSNIRKNLKEFYLDIYFRVKPLKYIKGEKIFLTTTDGLGDNIVRTKLLEKFLREYGSDNIVVLCKDKTKSFLEKLGFKNIIIYENNYRKRVSGKIKLIEKIAKLGINRIVSLEFDQHDIFIKYLKGIKKIGYLNEFNSKYNKYYNKTIKIDKKDYVIEQIKIFYNEYFRENLDMQELVPDISNFYNKSEKYKNIITIGIGSADRKKMLCSDKIVEILECLNKLNENQIILLGKGNLEKKLVEELEKKINFKNYKILNYINKLSLTETLEIINSSKLYIGVDSGLYNFAFGFRKNIVAFFEKKSSFSHDKFPNIKIVYGKSEQAEEQYFGTKILNSINKNEIMENLKYFLGGR